MKITCTVALITIVTAAGLGASPRQDTIAVEQLSGTMLTLVPNVSAASSLLRIAGPDGYEATVWNESGGPVTADLMLDGRFAGADVAQGDSAPILDGRYLPDGRYGYEAVFYQPGGRQLVQSGVFFVESGVAASRGTKRAELQQVRTALEGERQVSESEIGAEGTNVDDWLSVRDVFNSGDGATAVYMRSYTPPSGDTGETWGVWNHDGQFRVKAGLPQLNNQISPFTVTTEQRVGIGTTQPQADLHIFRPGGNIRLTDSDPCPNSNAAWEIEEDFGSLMFEVVSNCAGDNTGGKLWILGSGNIGIGTNVPGEELEIVRDFPSLRLRDNVGTAQIWDLEGNSFDFQVQDVTHGLSPLVVKPGTPHLTMHLSSAGVGIGTASPTAKLHVAGSGRIDGDVALGSSRTLKTGFGSVNPAEMLARVADLPLTSWRYKTEDEETRHVGPFAEDFQRLFGLGDGETISVIDAQGVTLAAIQGLQQELADKDAQIADLNVRLAALEARPSGGDVN